MVNEFIKLFTGYEGDFGIADMSKTSLDSNKNKIKPNTNGQVDLYLQ